MLQLEEQQVGQRQLVAIKPISFEENLTNISCRYGENIKFVLLSVLERMKYTIHLFRNQIKLLHSFSSLILNVKLDICLGQVEEKREKRQILPFFQKKCLEMSRKIHLQKSKTTNARRLKFCMSKHLEKMCLETEFQPIWLRNDKDIECPT